MRDQDLLKICLLYIHHLDEKKKIFVRDMQKLIYKRQTLNPAQHRYLQDCYDLAVACEFNLKETMAPGEDFFAIAAAKKKRF